MGDARTKEVVEASFVIYLSVRACCTLYQTAS